MIDCDWLTDDMLVLMLTCLRQLKNLGIGYCMNITQNSLRFLHDLAPGIAYLDLRKLYVNEDLVKTSLCRLTSLKILKLDLIGWSSKTLLHLFGELSALTKLHIDESKEYLHPNILESIKFAPPQLRIVYKNCNKLRGRRWKR